LNYYKENLIYTATGLITSGEKGIQQVVMSYGASLEVAFQTNRSVCASLEEKREVRKQVKKDHLGRV